MAPCQSAVGKVNVTRQYLLTMACASLVLCLLLGCGGGGGGGAPPPIIPPPQPFNLAGKVLDATGKGLAQAAVVVIVRATGQQVANTVSASTGDYGFFVPAGQYRVRATLAGYQPGQVDVNLYAGDKLLSVNITLTK